MDTDQMTRLEYEFRRFHKLNPDVYTELRDLALSMRRKGRKRWGIGGLFEVLRWHRALSTRGDVFKLNNNHRAFYARMLMDSEPELGGFFTTRERSNE